MLVFLSFHTFVKSKPEDHNELIKYTEPEDHNEVLKYTETKQKADSILV